MTIKNKLLIILSIIISILFLLSSLIVSNFIKNKKETDKIRVATSSLQAIASLSSEINNQMKEATSFLFFPEDKYKNNFENSIAKINEILNSWEITEEETSKISSPENSHLTKVKEIREIFNKNSEMLKRGFLLSARTENKELIFEIIEEEVKPWIDYILLEEIKKVMEDEIIDINNAYDGLLISLGAMPWISENSKEQILNARIAINDFYTIYSVHAAINKQLRTINNFLISGKEDNEKEFEEFGIIVKTNLNRWIDSLKKYKAYQDQEDIKTVLNVSEDYVNIIKIAQNVFKLRKQGKAEEGFKVMQNQVEMFLKKTWFPKINLAIEKNRNKITDSHQKLLNSIIHAGIKGIVFLTLLSLFIIFTVVKMINNMLGSIKKLKNGIELIAKGDLEHRIGSISKDEMGIVAVTFDKMVEELKISRGQILREHQKLTRLFKEVEKIKKEWERTMDCMDDMIILVDKEKRIIRSNIGFRKFCNDEYSDLINHDIEDIFKKKGISVDISIETGSEFFHDATRKWFLLNSYVFRRPEDDEITGIVISIHDSTRSKTLSQELEKKNLELETAYNDLKNTQSKILQQDKMASIGQLAAGVAHEINNPMSFIISNLNTLRDYFDNFNKFILMQTEIIRSEEMDIKRKELDIDYISDDTSKLIKESLDGAERVKKIVGNLKNFSRIDQSDFIPADINECIESTVNIVWNELKYKTTLTKEYGQIPLTKCFPQQLNQVFMNLLVNAAQAIEKHGEIKIKTWREDETILIAISDTGSGIPEKILSRIFEPFFTTKDIGKGTGLGLSITYEIIKKHNGEINVESTVGKGTTFSIKIPIVEES